MEPNTRVTISLTRTSNNRRDDYLTLRVTDAPSHNLIVETQLNAQDLMDLLTAHQVGGVEGTPAWLPTAPTRTHYGKTAYTATWSYPSFGVPDYDIDTMTTRIVSATRADHVSHPSRMNMGRTLIRFTAYFEDETIGQAWKREAQRYLDELTPPWEAETAK